MLVGDLVVRRRVLGGIRGGRVGRIKGMVNVLEES